jgi:hypothetical protein
MKYIWTEDTGAGLHFWELVNEHLFRNSFIVESMGSNQGILDAARQLTPEEGDRYYIAFDVVYDNMDVVNKYLELYKLAAEYKGRIVLLDMICFEHIILSFSNLAEWTGTGKKDKLAMRNQILSAIEGRKINIDKITDTKTQEFLMGFKRYSTERVIKALTYELTENKEWSVKGKKMGRCWYEDCCVEEGLYRMDCDMKEGVSGKEKMVKLFLDDTARNMIEVMQQVREKG